MLLAQQQDGVLACIKGLFHQFPKVYFWQLASATVESGSVKQNPKERKKLDSCGIGKKMTKHCIALVVKR